MSSTMASTKKSVRTIQRRGSRLLGISEPGGVADFSTHMGSTSSRDMTGGGIEVARGTPMKQASVRGDSSSSSSNGSVARIDPGGSSSSAGVPVRAKHGGRTLSTKASVFFGRAAPVRPHWPSTKNTSLEVITLARPSGSHPSTTSTQENSPQTTLDAISHGETHDKSGSNTRHSGDSSDIVGTSALGVQRAYGGPEATAVRHEYPMRNIRQPQPKRERAPRRPETEIDVEGSGRNTAQAPSRKLPRAEKRERDNTAAAKIGNILMELPLSKLKIVIGKRFNHLI